MCSWMAVETLLERVFGGWRSLVGRRPAWSRPVSVGSGTFRPWNGG
jgi:hypothetical protein